MVTRSWYSPQFKSVSRPCSDANILPEEDQPGHLDEMRPIGAPVQLGYWCGKPDRERQWTLLPRDRHAFRFRGNGSMSTGGKPGRS